MKNSLVQVDEDGVLTKFDASKARTRQDLWDVAIKQAERLRDWSAFEQAVAKKLAEQATFVAWWEGAVSVREKNRKLSSVELTISMEEAEKQTGIRNQQVSRWRKRLDRTDAYIEMVVSAARKKADDSTTIALLHTGDEESYTPSEFLESARSVMGGIDLDPASNAMAQGSVSADKYFTIMDDALTQEWSGSIWLNPPYTALVINRFLEKLVAHYVAGEVTQAIALTNNNTDTAWFHSTAAVASAICFTAGRINFVKPDGSRSSPTNGQLFFYLGDDVEAFKAEFSKHGLVMVKA